MVDMKEWLENLEMEDDLTFFRLLFLFLCLSCSSFLLTASLLFLRFLLFCACPAFRAFPCFAVLVLIFLAFHCASL